jgi:hypothetical protein
MSLSSSSEIIPEFILQMKQMRDIYKRLFSCYIQNCMENESHTIKIVWDSNPMHSKMNGEGTKYIQNCMEGESHTFKNVWGTKHIHSNLNGGRIPYIQKCTGFQF